MCVGMCLPQRMCRGQELILSVHYMGSGNESQSLGFVLNALPRVPPLATGLISYSHRWKEKMNMSL